MNSTDTIFEDNIYFNISQLKSKGLAQVTSFIRDRLVMSKVSIDTKIKLNHFSLPGSEKSTKHRGSIIDKRLSVPFLTKLRAVKDHFVTIVPFCDTCTIL